MSSTVDSVLDQLELDGYKIHKSSADGEWVEKVCEHVAKYITGKDRCTARTSIIVKNLVMHLYQRECSNHTQTHLPVQAKFFTMKMLDMGRNAFTGNIPKETARQSTEDSSESMDFTGEKNEKKPVNDLLIGTFMNDGSIRKHLHLADSSGRKLCSLILANPKYLNSTVLIEDWLYVRATQDTDIPFVGYIEVSTAPVILYRPKVTPGPKALSLSVRESLSGTVMRVSSCVKLRLWSFLMDILPDNGPPERPLLISGVDRAFWASCLVSGIKVTITGLKCTTITVAGETFPGIFVLTPSSTLIVHTTPPSNNKLLNIKDLGTVSKMSEIYLPSYSGKITKVVNLEFGIFELNDGKASLHCYFLFCEDFGCGLRVGASIMVMHAHSYVNCDTLHLVCCAGSRISLIEHSKTDDAWVPLVVSINTVAWLLEKNAFLHPLFTLNLLEFAEKVCKNFPFLTPKALLIRKLQYVGDVPASRGSILEKLLYKVSSKANTNNPSRTINPWIRFKRNSFSEVLCIPHRCIVKTILQQPPCSIRLLSVADLKTFVISEAEKQFLQDPFPDFWSYTRFQDVEIKPGGLEDLILLGCIKGSKTNGVLQLADNTGSIDMVIMREGGPMVNPGSEHILCPNFIDVFVRLTSFSVIVETALVVEGPRVVCNSEDLPSTSELLAPSQRKPAYHSYVICYFNDIIVLQQPHCTNPVRDLTLGCSRGCNTIGASTADKRAKLTGAGRKSHPHHSKSGGKTASPQMRRKSTVDHKIFTTNVQPMRKPGQSGRFFMMNGYSLGSQSPQNFPDTVVRFCGSAVKWKPFIYPGMALKVSVPRQVSDSVSDIVQVTDLCSVRHLRDNEAMLDSAEKRWENSFYGRQNRFVYTVSDVYLRPPSWGRQQTVRGFVVKHFVFPDKGLQLRVEITDESGDAKLCIYMGLLSNLPVLLGLIPGAGVVFKSINVCVSMAGNVYGKFEATSDVEVQSLPSVALKKNEDHDLLLLHPKMPSSAPGAQGQSHSEQRDKLDVVGASTSGAEDIENVVFAEPGTSKMEGIKETNKTAIAADAKEVEEIATPVNEVPCAVPSYSQCQKHKIGDLYQEQHHRHAIKINVRLMRIFHVRITLQPESCDDKKISLNAKCLAADNSGKICLHFVTTPIDSFFRFIGIKEDDIQEFIGICENSKLTHVEYDCQIHRKENMVLDFGELSKLRGSLARCTLVLLCNNANHSILPAHDLLVRKRKEKSLPDSETYSERNSAENFTAGTTAVGDRDQNLFKSLNLKPLQYNCLKVL